MTPVEQDPARELVARVLYNLDRAPGIDHWADIRSVPANDAIDASVAKIRARAVLAALAEAGRLLPDGGGERTEWAEACDVDMCKLPHGMCCYADDASDHKHTHRRTVTEWPDGSTHTTGWVEVGTDE